MSSMTEALISKDFKRPVLWDHRNKDYHTRKSADTEWRNHYPTLHMYVVYTQIYVQLCRSEIMCLHCVMMTLNYCTSQLPSSCHGTEPAGLWKNSQNRPRVCFVGAVTELRCMHSGFLEPSTAICIQAASTVRRKVTQTLNVYDNIVR